MIGVGPIPEWLVSKGEFGHTRRTREDEGRDCGDSSINTTTNHRNEERHEQILSLSLRRNQVCGYLDLGLQPPKLKQ